MWRLQYIVTLDSNAQGTFDRLSVALNNLTVAISQSGRIMSALTDSANALVAEIAEAITEIGTLSASIKDLTDKLAAAVAANNSAEIAAVTDELTKATTDLKTAVDAAAAATQPAPAA